MGEGTNRSMGRRARSLLNALLSVALNALLGVVLAFSLVPAAAWAAGGSSSDATPAGATAPTTAPDAQGNRDDGASESQGAQSPGSFEGAGGKGALANRDGAPDDPDGPGDSEGDDPEAGEGPKRAGDGAAAGGNPGADLTATPGSGEDPASDPDAVGNSGSGSGTGGDADPDAAVAPDPVPDAGGDRVPDDDGDPGPDPDPDPDAPDFLYVDELLLQWDEPDEFDVKHFVGDNDIVEPGYRRIQVTDYGKTVQLNGWYLSTDGTGQAYQTADSSTRIGSVSLSWESSDEAIAQVTPSGLVKPRGKNGTVVITATVADDRTYEKAAPAATVSIDFDGQEGRYVTRVEILDENGEGIGEEWGEVVVYTRKNEFHQLQARVTFYDIAAGEEVVEVTGEGDVYSAQAVGTTLTWTISSSNVFSVNKDTGRLRCGGYSGVAYVTCTATGGLGGAEVSDTANFQLDTGVYEYNPADALTLKVVWEERPDEVVKEARYSLDELKALLPARRVNATVVNDARFGVIAANGFLFKDVAGLVAVDDADVLQYRFQTADGYDNPVSYRYLFESGNRYYFPNYDVGGSRAEGEIVAPVLAYESVMEWDRAQVSPERALDDGTRFRLVFGCLATGDANTSFQIYYIHGITIVLKGAPSAGTVTGADPSPVDSGEADDPRQPDDPANPANPGDPKDPPLDPDDPEDPIDPPAPDDPDDPPAPDDPADPDDPDGRNLPDRRKGQPRSTKPGGDLESSSGNDQGAGGSESAVVSVGEGAPASASRSESDADGGSASLMADAAGADAGSSKRWRVYQMMNKANSDVGDWDDENPLSPFAMPLAAGTFAAGAGATVVGFRRRLR